MHGYSSDRVQSAVSGAPAARNRLCFAWVSRCRTPNFLDKPPGDPASLSSSLAQVVMLSPVRPRSPSTDGAVVYAPSFFESDADLIRALRQGHRGGRAVFYQRYARDVGLLVLHLLGPDVQGSESPSGRSPKSLAVNGPLASPGLVDLVDGLLLRAVSRVARRAPDALELELWLNRMVVRRALWVLRTRRVKWLTGRFLQSLFPSSSAVRRCGGEAGFSGPARGAPALTLAPKRVPAELAHRPPAPTAVVYQLLEQLPVGPRIAFCLHYFAGRDAGEIGRLCELPPAAARGMLLEGRRRFLVAARTERVLEAWVR